MWASLQSSQRVDGDEKEDRGEDESVSENSEDPAEETRPRVEAVQAAVQLVRYRPRDRSAKHQEW